MSHLEIFLSTDANVDTTTSMEPLDTGNVEDAPIVAMNKPKKSKRRSLVDDDTFSPPKLYVDNDGSDNVVKSCHRNHGTPQLTHQMFWQACPT